MSDIEATKIRIFKTHTKIPHKLIVRHDEFSMHFNIVLLPIIDLVLRMGLNVCVLKIRIFAVCSQEKKPAGKNAPGLPELLYTDLATTFLSVPYSTVFFR